MQESRIAPGLLIAMPQLLDPNFAHTTVLMIEHNAEGSLGVVINRPGSVTVKRLLEHVDLAWSGSAEALVGIGGPVMPGTLWLLHEPLADMPAGDGSREVTPAIMLSVAETQLAHIARHPPARLRVLLGYAGWGPGQLEEELVAGAWLHADATPELVFETPPERLWRAALDSIGVDPAALSPTPGRQ